MGNSLGGKRCAKIMKINGEVFKMEAPVRAGLVLEAHPGYVLLESEAVRSQGVQSKPLEPQQELKPKRLYFLVELPKFPEGLKAAPARRVRSGIHMTAKDRLETLMLARRSTSDLSVVTPAPSGGDDNGDVEGGVVRVRLRMPKAEVEKLMAESKDGAEMTEKIVGLFRSGAAAAGTEDQNGFAKRGPKLREKRVSFLPIEEEDIHIAVAS